MQEQDGLAEEQSEEDPLPEGEVQGRIEYQVLDEDDGGYDE